MRVCHTIALAIAAGSVASAAFAGPKNIFESIGCAYGVKRTGCASDYDRAVTAVRIDETTYHITAVGNAYTRRDTTYKFAMRRAAEETLASGYDLFAVVDQSDGSRQVVESVDGGYSSGLSASGQSTITPNAPITRSYILPGTILTIKMSRAPRFADTRDNVFDAREVLRFVGPPTATPAATSKVDR